MNFAVTRGLETFQQPAPAAEGRRVPDNSADGSAQQSKVVGGIVNDGSCDRPVISAVTVTAPKSDCAEDGGAGVKRSLSGSASASVSGSGSAVPDKKPKLLKEKKYFSFFQVRDSDCNYCPFAVSSV